MLRQGKKICESLILDVSKENIIAINLYKKSGFEVCEERSSKLSSISVLKKMKKFNIIKLYII
jgi:ribosomal protein S18 acetylase RimI-like enzyme